MSAADAPFIRRHARDEKDPLGFWGLRAQGLANAQALSAEHWTDYNLHDPGVTILEQVCFALTGLVYRSDFSVADHLAQPDGRIDFKSHALHPADVVFPCRPTTADDYRRFLLDRIDGLADAIVETATGASPGVWRVALRLASDHEGHAQTALRQAGDLLRSHRNIGEDFAHEVALVKDRWCRLAGEIEIGGARESSDILAEVYLQCEQQIAAWGRFEPMDALLDASSLEEIFSGPPVHRGRLSRPVRDDDRIFISDLMAGLRSIEGVREVRRLTLSVEGDDALPREAIERRGPGWALRLRVPTHRGHASGLRLVRRGTTVEPAIDAVHMKYEDLLAGTRSLQAEAGATAFIGPRPTGVHREPGPYRPVQEQFPAVYAINHFGLEPGASSHAQAQVWQLKAYLALFDQVMAHSAAQLSHLRELFTVEGPTHPSTQATKPASSQTYWWQMIDDSIVQDIEHRLYTATPQHIEQRVYRTTDHYIDRKGRLLDYLLSLHGEDYSQNSLRQFASGYTPAELEARLFENKASVLRDIVQFSRDRGAGFDDSQPTWDRVGHEGGLQRRVGLLLGFAQTHTRSLTTALRTVSGPAVGDVDARRVAVRPEGLQRVSLEAVKTPSRDEAAQPSGGRASVEGLNRQMTLIRCGAQADHYWIEPLAAGTCRLYVGPDEYGAFWDIGVKRSVEDAARMAWSLRNLLLGMNEQAEGLFIVEHILLRPAGGSAAHRHLEQQHRIPEDALQQRVTAVFPAWPLRCREANFQHLAAETTRLNAPAHMRTDCIWLDWDEMKAFEESWRKWLDERREWCNANDSDAVRVLMNHAACEVLGLLFEHIGQTAEGSAP